MKIKQHQFKFKASWQGTALTFYIMAKDEDQAWARAMRYVKRMEGRDTCLDLELKD